jgi:hypothetical protein
VARVIAFIPDLLFGSNVLGALQAAGHETSLTNDPASAEGADVLVVDLTAEPQDRIARVQGARLERPRILAFYSHVESEVRELARDAGFDLVIPRSRMAREGPALVARLADSASD